MTDQQTALRREVGLLRARESRRVFHTVVAVGDLGGEGEGFVVRAQDLPVADAALRTDVMCALLAQVGEGPMSAWLARSGFPETCDVDLGWLAAAIAAFGIHGRTLAGFYAITRADWLDVRTGETRVWRRLRL